MTVSTTANRNDYDGNSCAKAFAYSFKILATSDVEVYVDKVLKSLGPDYSVTGAGESTGGTVTFVTAPGCVPVALVRAVPYTQATDYVENDPFTAATHEDALDKVTLLAQQVKELATRAWRFAAGSKRAAAGYTVPDPVASRYVRIAADCLNIEYVALENCGTYENPVTTKGDMIQGDDCGKQQRIPIGSFGHVIHSACGGKVRWELPGGVALTNQTDAQADAGRLFVISRTCDKAFLTGAGDPLGCSSVYVVASTAVGDDCEGLMLHSGGPIRTLSVGQIARGDYLRKSATLGAVQTTCVNFIHHRPVPRGTVGLALSPSAGDCVDMLKFPFTFPGMQGLSVVRGNKTISDVSTANSVCTRMNMLADSIVLRDSCNDIVVIQQPGSITNDITVDNTNKDNGRDQSGAFSAGDIHFYWVYEGVSGTLKTRSSTVPPCDRTGPILPVCETHWAYSHSMYWNANCMHRVTVRGRTVYYECERNVLSGVTGNCETRTSLVTLVPLAATAVHLQVRAKLIGGGTIADVYRLGHRLNCIGYTVPLGSAATGSNSTRITMPNVNQEFYYRFEGASTQGELTVDVLGYDVPNGDS